MPFVAAPWDRALFAAINGSRDVLADLILPWFSSSGVLWLAAVGAVGVLGSRHGLRPALWVGLLLGLAVGVSDVAASWVKDSVARPRPLAVEPGVWAYEHGAWVRHEAPPGAGRSSFPSAHAANAAAAVGVLVGTRRWRLWGAVFPVLVGYSRIYVGKHYPTDVLAGWLLGVAVGLVVLVVAQRTIGLRRAFADG